MKLRNLLVAALAAVSLGATAQNDFNPYWYANLQGGVGYSHGGHDKITNVITPAAAVSVGYRFSRVFGARLHASGWQGKNGWDKSTLTYKWTYGNLGLDATIDLSTIFAGYNADRFFNVGAVVGIGWIHGFENDDAVAWNAAGNKPQFQSLWQDKYDFFGARAGLTFDFRLSKRWSLNLEGLVTGTGERFNSKNGPFTDLQTNVFAGVTYRFCFGEEKEVVTYVPAPVVPVVEEVVEVAPAPAPAPAPKPAPAPAPVKKELRKNVFFQINSAKISAAELVKVNEVVEFLNANPEAKVAITGYADKGTGNAVINKRLSLQRANAVYNALLKQKIAAERIVKDAKGDTEQPFANNDDNRVVIAIAE